MRKHACLLTLLILVGCAAPALPLPVSPYQARRVGVMVTGHIVLASAQVRTTAGTLPADKIGVCAVDQAGNEVDWPAGGGTLTESWLTVSSTRSFPAGDYTARVCVVSGGHDQQVDGETTSFTVY